MRKILKEAGAILLLAVLVFSTTAVIGQNVNIDARNATSLTEISQPSSTVINNEPQSSSGPILWDNGLPDASNGLSCVLWPSNPLDRLVIDDFYVPEGGWEIGDGHFRIVTYNGLGPEIIDNVLVYFFYNTGPCEPSMEEYIVADPEFTGQLTGDYYFDRPEILVDVVFDPPVVLPMDGEWWVCFQPEMEDNSFWLTAATKYCSVYVDYPDLGAPRWTYGYIQFEEYYDVSFVLTGVGEPCNPGIDVEKYVLDLDGKWIDADTENTALDLPICHDGQFKIVITNTGDCALINIVVKDIMHESLKYLSADPEPDNVVNTPPDWVMDWMFPGPLAPGATIEIFVNFHVEGPECSVDYNHVLVEGFCEECPGEIVNDEDWCWVHAYKKSKDLNMPFLQFLQSHPKIFPLLQKLLNTLGL
jgi:hypothetical protein